MIDDSGALFGRGRALRQEYWVLAAVTSIKIYDNIDKPLPELPNLVKVLEVALDSLSDDKIALLWRTPAYVRLSSKIEPGAIAVQELGRFYSEGVGTILPWLMILSPEFPDIKDPDDREVQQEIVKYLESAMAQL